MRADAAAGLVLERLGAAGIDAVLLKGSALTDLYPDRPRQYVDADVLVHERDLQRVHAVLREAGYGELLPGMRAVEQTTHAITWSHERLPDLDLHTTLWGSGLDDAATFEALWQRTEPHVVAGHACRKLDAVARAVHLALHAAQSGRGQAKPMDDLLRGLLTFDEEVWQSAADLASRLDAEAPFAMGLRLHPTGAAIANRLCVTDAAATLEVRLSMEAAARGAVSIARLAARPTLRGKIAYGIGRLFPSPELLRFDDRVARRGGAWFVVGYGRRLARIARSGLAAYRAYRVARRDQR
jgi:hypothetical protein